MNDTAKCVVQQIHSSNSLFLFFNVVQALCAVDTCGGRVVVLVHVVVDSKKRAVGPGRVVLGTESGRPAVDDPDPGAWRRRRHHGNVSYIAAIAGASIKLVRTAPTAHARVSGTVQEHACTRACLHGITVTNGVGHAGLRLSAPSWSCGSRLADPPSPGYLTRLPPFPHEQYANHECSAQRLGLATSTILFVRRAA